MPCATADRTSTRASKERLEKPLMIWGRIPLVTKVSTRATGGALYAFGHPNMAKGGPPLHVHHDQVAPYETSPSSAR